MKKVVLGFLLAIIVMLVIGIVMLFSTGAFARDAHGDPIYFVKRQSMWLGVGLITCMVAACLDYHLWQKHWKILFATAVVLLALCFLFPKINGSHRWLKIGGFSFQPSEIGKIAAIAFIATWFSTYADQSAKFLKGFVQPLAAVGILMGLIAFEEDLGTTALIGGSAILTMFVAGSNLAYLSASALAGLSGIFFIAINMPERLGRLMAFTDLEKYKETSGHQQYEALIALGSGGVEGLGLGNGRQKMEFLPFAHTDFIFPMIGEELGLIFTLLVVFCYLLLIICGVWIALHANDRFGALFGFGLIILIALQAAMNIGVTTALLPNKGIPLPFISYGGSNLVFCLMSVGILLNIYRQGINERTVRVTTKLSARVSPRI